MPKKSKPDPDPANTVSVGGPPEERPRLIAQLAVTPSLQAGSTIKRWSQAVGELDITSLIEELRQQAATASSGDLTRQEATLAIQAHTLDTMFNELARRSQANMFEGYGEAAERYMRLALKAQSQCRTTIETLSEMKNPKPVAFVQQANIAHGPQQVNNRPEDVPACEEKVDTPQNTLLEKISGEWLDSVSTSRAVGSDPAVAPVGTIDGTKDSGR